MPKTTEKTLIGTFYHQKMPNATRKAFKEEVIKATSVHFTTFYNWMNGVTKPTHLEQKTIVDILNRHLTNSEGVTTDDVAFGRYEQAQ